MKHSQQFEDVFTNWLGVQRSFSFWKGRVGLYVLLKSLGIGLGDKVIVPGYTCVMAVAPVIYAGAKPVYVDINPLNFNMNIEKVNEVTDSQTKAIIVQHTYGIPAVMDLFLEFSKKRNLFLIEDCCMALGSKYNGRTVGTFGIASYFSFQWSKSITTGLGGMLAVNDTKLAETVDKMQTRIIRKPTAIENGLLGIQIIAHNLMFNSRTAMTAEYLFRKLSKVGLLIGSSNKYDFVPKMPAAFLKKMGSFQSAAGIKKMKLIEENIQHRKRLRELYDKLLYNCGFPPLAEEIPDETVLIRYPLRAKEKKSILKRAQNSAMEIGSYFESPLHPAEANLVSFGYLLNQCPESEKAAKETINLPLHPKVSESNAKKIVKWIAKETTPF